MTGRYLVGQNDIFPIGTIGGEKNVTLTKQDQNAPHSHTISSSYNGQALSISGPSQSGVFLINGSTNQGSYNDALEAKVTGGGSVSHENMPPYRTVYRFRRIA